jgi:hypothetical protein
MPVERWISELQSVVVGIAGGIGHLKKEGNWSRPGGKHAPWCPAQVYFDEKRRSLRDAVF